MSKIRKQTNRNPSLNTNLEKSYPLEFATAVALDNLNATYVDYTGIYNFHSYGGNKHVPDYLTSNYLIEDKNWNCENYHVNHVKTYNEIYKRWTNFLEYKPVLIISNPKWVKKEKAWLYSMGWKILELEYFVTWNNLYRAINKITLFLKELFGYVNTVPNKLIDKHLCNNLESQASSFENITLPLYDKTRDHPPINPFEKLSRLLKKVVHILIFNLSKLEFKGGIKKWNYPRQME